MQRPQEQTMTQLRAGYDRQAVREPIDRVVAEQRNALTAPEGRKVTDACGSSSASGRAPPHKLLPARSASRAVSPGPVRRICRTPDLDAAFRAHIPPFGPT